ncbi:hypothetical protein ACXO6I_09735, partial [Lactobacillus delbrueckii subsp. bulgaricus]
IVWLLPCKFLQLFQYSTRLPQIAPIAVASVPESMFAPSKLAGIHMPLSFLPVYHLLLAKHRNHGRYQLLY